MNHLTSLFGMLDDNVAEDFEAVDENRDGVVSKQESKDAFENLDRKGKDRTFKMKNAHRVLESDKRRIINLANGHLENKDLSIFGDNFSFRTIAEGIKNDLEENIGGDWFCSFGTSFSIYGRNEAKPRFWLHYTKGDFKVFCFEREIPFSSFWKFVDWGYLSRCNVDVHPNCNNCILDK